MKTENMNWTKKKPTKNGYYWVRNGDDMEWPIFLDPNLNFDYTIKIYDIVEFSSVAIPKPSKKH